MSTEKDGIPIVTDETGAGTPITLATSGLIPTGYAANNPFQAGVITLKKITSGNIENGETDNYGKQLFTGLYYYYDFNLLQLITVETHNIMDWLTRGGRSTDFASSPWPARGYTSYEAVRQAYLKLVREG